MAVNLTASGSLNGAAIADLLAGDPANFGVDMGQVANNSYAPLVSKAANTGSKLLFLRHDAVTDPISSFSMYLQAFGVGTGYPYGGADSAVNDLAAILAMGAASGVSKNNADGSSGGVWVEMQADVNTTNQFDAGTRSTWVKTFGKAGIGADLATSILVAKEAMVYDAAGQQNATSPVDGFLGKSGDTALGDNCRLAFRFYVPNTFLNSGIIQWENVFTYAFTS